MSGLAQIGRSLAKVLSPEPMIGLDGEPPPNASLLSTTALALLEDLLDAKRIMPTEYRTLRAALMLALRSDDDEDAGQ